MTWEWTDWIAHDDKGWPRGLEPDEIVIVDINGDIMLPMPARDVDWHFPPDPVLRYKIRLYKVVEVVKIEAYA